MPEFHREDVHVTHTINNMAELEQTCVGQSKTASKASFYAIPPLNARITVSCSELTGRCSSAQNQQPFLDLTGLSLQDGSCRGGRKVTAGCGLPVRK